MRPTTPHTHATPRMVELVERKLAEISPTKGGHMRWPGRHCDGYGVLRIRVSRRSTEPAREVLAQRAVWLVNVGPISADMILRSTCGVRDCVAPAHHRVEPRSPRRTGKKAA